MLPKVLMTKKVAEEAIEAARLFSDLEIWGGEDPIPRRFLMSKIASVEGLFCLLTDKIDEEVLSRASRLRVVSTMAVGFDHIDVNACTSRKIVVGHTPDVLTDTTADFAFTLLMCAARRVVEGMDYVRAGSWKTWCPTLLLGQDIYEGILGLIGFGRIGQAMAKRARGFQMRVLVSHSTVLPKHMCSDFGVEQVDFADLLREVDFLSLHVPLTPETYHLMNAQAFHAMKRTAILVNTARGAVVDTEALYEALVTQRIQYAALDVTDPEPLPPTHPLIRLPNCLVVPHIASASVATRKKMALLAVENLRAGLLGQKLPYCVNPEAYPQG